MSTNLNDIAVSNINGADYRCIINGISKSDTLNVLKNSDLTKKENYKEREIMKFITIYKTSKEIIMFGDIKV